LQQKTILLLLEAVSSHCLDPEAHAGAESCQPASPEGMCAYCSCLQTLSRVLPAISSQYLSITRLISLHISVIALSCTSCCAAASLRT
jgi:hypothetical protein